MFKKIFLLLKKNKSHKELFLLCSLIIILLYPFLLHPYYTFFPQSDIGIYSAWKDFLVGSFKTFGSIPLWNPYVFGGTPFIGNSQVGFFYPITLLYFIFPVKFVFGYIFVLDLILSAAFTYAYARLIKLTKLSSLIASCIFIFNGCILSQVFLGHIIILDSFVWFPILLYIYEKIVQDKKLYYSFFLGIVFGIMLLAGNAQIPLYAFIASTFYYYVRFLWENKKNIKSKIKYLFIPFISFAIGLSLSAIQLLPTLEFSKLSIRSTGISYQFASDFSLHPKQLLIFLFPSLFGSDINNSYWGIGSFWGTIIYTGIIPFYLFLVGFIKKRNTYFYIFLGLLIFSIIYSLGKYSPLFKIFFDYVPFFNNFRVPTRMLFVYAFSFSIVSGLGFQFLEEKVSEKKDLFFNYFSKFLFLLFAASSILLIILYINKDNISLFEKFILKNSYAQGINHIDLYYLIINDILIFCFFTFLFLTSLVLILKKKITRNFFLKLLFILIILDYFIFYSKFIKPNNVNTSYNKDLSFIKSDVTRFRVYSQPAIPANITSDNKIESLSGYDPLYLKSYRDFIWKIGPHVDSPYESSITITSITNTTNLKLLNVKYVLSKTPIKKADLKEVFKGNYFIYILKGYLPRAYLTFNKSPNYVLGEKLQEVSIKDYQPNLISLSFNTKNRGFLVLSELIYPGWKVYDNKTQIQIVSSNKIFRAVRIEAGHHEVVFKYEPDSYRIGKIITVATIVIIIFILFYIYKREK